MKTQVFFGFTIIVLIIQGCFGKNCQIVSLSKNDKEWLVNYGVNDTLVFVSDKNNRDTFIVVNSSTTFTPCNRIELSDYQYEEAWAKLVLTKCQYTAKEYRCVWFELSKSLLRATDPCYKTFSVFNLKVSGIRNLAEIPKRLVSLGDNCRLESYYFTSGDNITQDMGGEIKSFYWNTNKGLLGYTTKKNESFTLLSL